MISEVPDQQIVKPVEQPIHEVGTAVILKGSLAPDGAVIKTAGVEMTEFTGIAKVYDREEYAFDSNVGNDNSCSSFIKLILSVRTFKTFEERLRDKLEYTSSGRLAVQQEIINIIFNALQYVAENRKSILPSSKTDFCVEE